MSNNRFIVYYVSRGSFGSGITGVKESEFLTRQDAENHISTNRGLPAKRLNQYLIVELDNTGNSNGKIIYCDP